MKKIEAILGVYGINAVNKDLSFKVKGEKFFAWAIVGLSKTDLKKLSNEEIEYLYYHAL